MASEPLEIVEEWKRKTFDFSNQSDDSFVSVISRSHDAVWLILKNADPRRIKHALSILDSEKSISISLDKEKDNPIRSMMYGAVESFHLALVHLTEQMNKSSKVEWTQTEENHTVDPVISEVVSKQGEIVAEETDSPDLIIVDSVALDSAPADNISTVPTFCNSIPLFKLEIIDPSENQLIPAEVQISPKETVGDEVNIKKEEITKEEIMDDDSMPYLDFMGNDAPQEVKKETYATEDREITPLGNGSINEQDYDVMEGPAQDEMFDNNENSVEDDMIKRERKKKKKKGKTDKSADATKNSSVTGINNEKRSSSRRVSKPLKYLESEGDSEVDEVPSMNKSKAESNETNGRKRKSANEDVPESVSSKKERRIVNRRSGTELKCIECEYRSQSVTAWICHLRIKHSTTPALSGLALRCECGHDGFSNDHNYKCDISNFTVIREKTGPIRRLDDEKLTPQCILCEKYPRTACGYIQHLYKQHKTYLAANNIHLKCECGLIYTSGNTYFHLKECDGRRFSLHKNADD